MLWKELNRETQVHGLATTGGVVGTTGIAGLTLGGGLGWLMPKYGLALDNLRSAELVMADGSVRRASADSDPDLFWAIRGGGGNFGIVASFEYDVHPVGPMITGGLVAHPLARGRDVLKFFREYCAKLPDEVMLAAGMLTAPDGSGAKLVGVLACHAGSLADGARVVQPIKAFGPPIMDQMGPLPYCAQNGLLDALDAEGRAELLEGALPHRPQRRLHRDAHRLLREVLVADEPDRDRALPRGGQPRAGDRYGLRDAARGIQRRAHLPVERPARNGPAHRRGAARPTPRCAVSRHVRYVNYLADDEAGDPVAIAYGPNYARLRRAQDEIRPGELLSHEREHQAALSR